MLFPPGNYILMRIQTSSYRDAAGDDYHDYGDVPCLNFFNASDTFQAGSSCGEVVKWACYSCPQVQSPGLRGLRWLARDAEESLVCPSLDIALTVTLCHVP